MLGQLFNTELYPSPEIVYMCMHTWESSGKPTESIISEIQSPVPSAVPISHIPFHLSPMAFFIPHTPDSFTGPPSLSSYYVLSISTSVFNFLLCHSQLFTANLEMPEFSKVSLEGTKGLKTALNKSSIVTTQLRIQYNSGAYKSTHDYFVLHLVIPQHSFTVWVELLSACLPSYMCTEQILQWVSKPDIQLGPSSTLCLTCFICIKQEAPGSQSHFSVCDLLSLILSD